MLGTPEAGIPAQPDTGAAVEGAMASRSFCALVTLIRTSSTHGRCAFRHSVDFTTTVASRVGLSASSYKGSRLLRRSAPAFEREYNGRRRLDSDTQYASDNRVRMDAPTAFNRFRARPEIV